MDTNELTKTAKMMQTIQLVKGVFTASEASDVMMALIDEKIHFHQKQRLQQWEQNHQNNPEKIKERIKQLENEKAITKAFIENAKDSNKTIAINGILEISII
jgi:adenosyl cobinamide kinase/adenosyl cobinamide phosphate guanylyltransferase